MKKQLNKLIKLLLITCLSLTSIFTSSAHAADLVNGAQIFEVHCVGCHINGGNIVRRGKTLKKKALKKYGMDSLEAISSIVTNGKNNMSAYKDRLTAEQIQDVAAYVLEQSAKDWR
ncbi:MULTISPECIES: cytochrome c6 PetJ [unclassified Tolypothrix]|uniref:cytochrome c6 PetJ n=1 Tax=unclassified Tolypothrix TaxID=2649714 RepID=UPI0005EAB67A|nr:MULTISPECIES: c-type cytochrome [unclassified Tolypothrix]BAY89625.1 cytochrome c class I [Microchaete diplosiphon NIES-3275]EKF02616.1 cytochrome c [Tolypothrix sp. PCC 7601]MBE9084756.1 c-type cytochrome [Tolypothrix sp. LEGE 11397]UYD23895.1 c-type cytochrome [Tolypothrix sp. PCC 7712]UYD33880.1 c-type cytochrome [Tolypothrix sp. PCC 7601]